MATATAFKSFITPFTSPTGLLVLITLATSLMYAFIPSIRDFLDEKIINDFLDSGDEKGLLDYLEAQNLAATALGLLIPGGVFVKIGRVLLGNLGVEFLEEGWDAIEDTVVQPGIGQKLFVELLTIKKRLENLEPIIKPPFF